MAHGKMGPQGPKRGLAGKKGTNRPTKVPKGSSGAKGGKMIGRMTPPLPNTIGGSSGPGAPY